MAARASDPSGLARLFVIKLDLHTFFFQFNFVKILNFLNTRLINKSQNASTLESSLQPEHVRVYCFSAWTVFRLNAIQRYAGQSSNTLDLCLLKVNFDPADKRVKFLLLLRNFDCIALVINGPRINHFNLFAVLRFVLFGLFRIQIDPRFLVALFN